MSEVDNRQRILEEALRLFAHHGYASTSVREVAEAAGITKPTLYYYFGSKEGLFHALIDQNLNGLQRLVQGAIDGQGTVAERMKAFLGAYLLGALKDIDAVRFMLTCGTPNSVDPPYADVVTRHLQYIAPLSKVIRQGISSGELRADTDPHVGVVALVGAANLHLVAALRGDIVDATTVDRLLNTWLHGVAA